MERPHGASLASQNEVLLWWCFLPVVSTLPQLEVSDFFRGGNERFEMGSFDDLIMDHCGVSFLRPSVFFLPSGI